MGWQDDPVAGGWQADPLADEPSAFAGAKASTIADPKIGQPEELTWAEKLAQRFLPDALGDVAGGNMRGSGVGRVMMGAADPGVAAVQMGANLASKAAEGSPWAQAFGIDKWGEKVNRGIQGTEGQYQAARKEAGSEGFDPLRAVGSAVITAPLGAAGVGLVRGAAIGGASSALDPITDGGGEFWTDKAQQVGTGAALGGALSPILGALARVVSPKASQNADLDLLRKEGVKPTIGQALGGFWNKAEEKATSIPIMGDMIAKARRGSVEDFNNATLNKALEPIGERVEGFDREAIKEAGDKLSRAYQDAVAGVNHVNFTTPNFALKLSELEQLATGLKPDLQPMFTKIIDNVIGTKMSQNGSILGADLKAVDSTLGKLAANYRNAPDPFTRELGDAVLQLKTIFMDEVRTAAPAVAAKLKDADRGWAWLVRAENAGKRAVNNEGVFTPGQYNFGIRSADKSARGRKSTRGEDIASDLGDAAQSVLGNKYPDSGTAGRLMNVLTAGSAMVHPGPMLAAVGGAAMYTKPVQNALVRLLADRPEYAPVVANYLRRLTAPAALGAGTLSQEFN